MARDVIFCGPRKDAEAQCESLASEFGLRKIVFQKKKNLLSWNYAKIAIIAVMRFIFKKSASSYRVKNGRKSQLKAFVSKKKDIHHCFSNHVPLTICRCAASLFKVLYADTNFLPKLKKSCHEVMVDNC